MLLLNGKSNVIMCVEIDRANKSESLNSLVKFVCREKRHEQRAKLAVTFVNRIKASRLFVYIQSIVRALPFANDAPFTAANNVHFPRTIPRK